MLHEETHIRTRLWGLGILALIFTALSIFIGRYPEPYFMSPRYLWLDELARLLIWELRLPRILTAFFMGMALSASGAAQQTIFRNPLVCSGFLGVSQGAAFGAAFSIIFLSNSPFMIEFSATFFALCGLIIAYALAWGIRYGDWVLRLVLGGIVSSALFSSALGVLKYMADPLKELPDIVFWLLGGLWPVGWREFLYIAPVVAIGLVVLILMGWRINLLSLDDETAFSLGAAPVYERGVVILASVAITAVVVAVAGIVSWIGLIVPHLARRVVGADAQWGIPASMLIGGVFTVFCDNLARTLLAGEIPLGIITALIGPIIFVLLFFGKGLRDQ